MWLYFRFPLSLRLVEEMLLERGIVVSYETVRRWAMKFGRDYARRLKRKRASRRDIWHLDEVVVTIGGKQHWLWRAVDQDGYILDEIVQTRRDTKAAKRLLTRLLKKQGCPPRRMITDKLGSYAAARRPIMPAIEHRSHKGLNNRAENSHLPLRRRERAMQGFRSPGSLQRRCHINLDRRGAGFGRPAEPQAAAVAGSPRPERFVSEDAKRAAGSEMALDVEDVVDGGMKGQESLG